MTERGRQDFTVFDTAVEQADCQQLYPFLKFTRRTNSSEWRDAHCFLEDQHNHGDKNASASVHIVSKHYVCHGCNYKASPTQVYMDHYGCDAAEARRLISDAIGADHSILPGAKPATRKQNGKPSAKLDRSSTANKGRWKYGKNADGKWTLTDTGDGTVYTETERWSFPLGDGTHNFDEVRFEDEKGNKEVRPQRRDGHFTKDECPVVLYGLPDLLEADPDKPVILTEGPRKAELVRSEYGYPATSIPFGAGKWDMLDDGALEPLRDRQVLFLPDHDDAGRTHVESGKARLEGIASQVLAITVEDLEEALGKPLVCTAGSKKGSAEGADIIDAYKLGLTQEQFDQLVQSALSGRVELEVHAKTDRATAMSKSTSRSTRGGEEHESDSSSALSNDPECQLPRIDASDHNMPRISEAAWDALQSGNNPARMFRHGSIPVRVENDDENEPQLRRLTEQRMRHELARAAFWFKTIKQDDQDAFPPKEVVQDVLATPDPPLPVLTRIVQAPVFGPDGALHVEPGYHPSGRTFYAPSEGFVVRDVSPKPAPAEVELARKLLVDNLILDFPFASQSDRAHAVALLLLPFVRDMIRGPTPLHLIEAPTQGTGKSLLAEVLMYLATGRSQPNMTEGRDEDEWRKRLTAKLRQGPSVVLIDNVRLQLDCSALASAITGITLEDRILGQSDMVRTPIRCVWIATGNNPALSGEMARRIVRVRLDAKIDRPWQREGFLHPDIRGFLAENRSDLVWTCLTLIQNWIAQGKPLWQEKLGGFEAWSTVMGGILQVTGIPGFLENLDEFYDESDSEGVAWRGFVGAWWDQHQDQPVRAADLFTLADDQLDLGRGTDHSRKIVLGKQLQQARDRQFDDLRITNAGTKGRAQIYRLVRVKPAGEHANV